ncbi:MAG: HAD-IA family hydrolase [Acidobacteriota bacterium]
MGIGWHPRAIKAVLFDFDGTLTRPGCLDFPRLRRRIGCPPGKAVLEFIAELPPDERQKRTRLLEHFEFEAAAGAQPNRGAEPLIECLKDWGLSTGIVSRNSRRSVMRALQNFHSLEAADFAVIVCRDHQVQPKPDPAGILLAAERMEVAVKEMLVVGDFIFDIDAGQRAGAPTVFLTNGSFSPPQSPQPDHVVDHLDDLKDLICYLRPLPAGKLPNALLARFLEESPPDDPSILIRPGVGEDAAAVQVRKEDEVLILKSDPITFTTDQAGYSTLLINANDVAASGGVPRWLLTTLLFPVGSSARQIHLLFQELQLACREYGLSLCGGHTEITDAVTRPVVVGQMVGTVSRKGLLDKSRMSEGDVILFTKGVAVEGTSILAREFPDRLRSLGMAAEEVEKCRKFLSDPGIGILREAGVAARWEGVTAMHDVTEGGLSTALRELSVAGRHRVRVFVDRIPILPETARICGWLQIDPLGLIASGSLLIACRPDGWQALARRIRRKGVRVRRIGEVLGRGKGVEALDQGRKRVKWPRFEADELGRALARLSTASPGVQE